MTNSWSLLYEEMMNTNDEDRIILNDDPLDKIANETYDQFSSTFTDTLTEKLKKIVVLSIVKILYLKNYPIIFLAHITSTTRLELIKSKLLILLKHVGMEKHSADPISSSMPLDMTRKALLAVIS